jgi:thioredoxin reductase
METLDVLIIGGGPAGLNAALVLTRARRRVAVIDAGRPRNERAESMHGYLSRDGIAPRAFLELGREELKTYGVAVLADEVVEVEKTKPDGPHCRTSFAAATKGGRRFAAKKVLFATGTCDDAPDLPGVAECYGVSVHHCPYCDGWEHRDRRLTAFSSEPDKAIGLGLLLRGWSDRVTALTHGAQASAEDRWRAGANGLAIVEARVERLVRTGRRLRGVAFDGGQSIEADALFFNTGQRQSCDLPQKLGCALEDRGLLASSNRQRSTVPGVFLAGDADGDVQFVIVAAAEGAKAAVVINKELQEDEHAQ